jgi:hypothetical protein
MTARTGPVEQASALDGGIRIVGEGIIRNVNLLRRGSLGQRLSGEPETNQYCKTSRGFRELHNQPFDSVNDDRSSLVEQDRSSM